MSLYELLGCTESESVFCAAIKLISSHVAPGKRNGSIGIIIPMN